MEQLVGGLVVFLGAHIVPMFRNLRASIAGKIGLVMYQAVFALISLLGIVLVARGYAGAEFVALWEPPSWSRHVTYLLMLFVFPLLAMSSLPGQFRKWIPHPMLMAVKIWAVAHLISNGDLASLLLFGSFLAYGVINLISVKRRDRAKGVSPKIGPLRNDVIAVLIGLALYAGMLFWGHGALIGVSLTG